MAGHSHWAGIKHKKAATDAKRAQIFSKLLKAISAAAKGEPNPEFNPRLRSVVEKARQFQIPRDVIERAIARAGQEEALAELLFEAYGPGGAAILIESLSSNRNRAVQEIKKILIDHGGRWAEPGSVQWAFQKTNNIWQPKFPQEISERDALALGALVDALEENEDVQNVITNAA